MKQNAEQFTMDRYGLRPPFASFLPGIAGLHGVPIWCYYVNRGQGVVSFGVDNKDRAVMEFLPAHRAFEAADRRGFRTFLRRDGRFFEAFAHPEQCSMTVEMNALSLTDRGGESGLAVAVDYFVLPEERVGALVRRVRVTNVSGGPCAVEMLDGMPELIPYGVGDGSMKGMPQTTKAWMQVEDVPARRPYYRVRVSMGDSARVGVVEGGSFALGFDEDGALLPVVADGEALFDQDTALARPDVFAEGGLAAVLARPQHSSNLLPCAFFAREGTLRPGESFTVSELIGQVDSRVQLDRLLERKTDDAWFRAKHSRARALTDELCAPIQTATGDPVFDAYCKYTYMDNVLRGGMPLVLGADKVFYAYSRKHGDLERDYNFFSMLPELYSQGNGNYRDVNQNRRSDTFFSPFVGRQNIHAFFSLIQPDGYNPLVISMQSYALDPQRAQGLASELPGPGREALERVLAAPFTPGRLYETLLDSAPASQAEGLFSRIMTAAEARLDAAFGEGYWTDHWTYDLDLIEEYLAVFPEQERELLYERAYTYYAPQAAVAPRARRYARTENGIRQYHALDDAFVPAGQDQYLHGADGELIRGTLAEKLALLCAVKFAALDPYGMGVEMEGGKPGWYDALNGLPGMLGSSMAETYELARLLRWTIGALERSGGAVELIEELAAFLDELEVLCARRREDLDAPGEIPAFWDELNDAKERYRARVYAGLSGRRTVRESKDLVRQLNALDAFVRRGVAKAQAIGAADGRLCPTYFAYDVTDFTEDRQGIHPRHFSVHPLPAFLEGPVRYLKLDLPAGEKQALYEAVRASQLYDEKLSMYRVNASLQEESYELGRARAFTPGWLENGSIWLHMEYKYLLELLRCGMYDSFFRDFRAAAVPFLDPEVYGRSTLENSSFIASSVNPNESLHGRGFVARLSGSTAEMLSIWRRMMFGEQPFTLEHGQLVCRLTPAIPAWLIGGGMAVTARFLGSTDVTYRLADRADHTPGNYRVAHILVRDRDGIETALEGDALRGDMARALRAGDIASLELTLTRR